MGGSQHTQHTAHSTAPIYRYMLYLASGKRLLACAAFTLFSRGGMQPSLTTGPKNKSGKSTGLSLTPVSSGPAAFLSFCAVDVLLLSKLAQRYATSCACFQEAQVTLAHGVAHRANLFGAFFAKGFFCALRVAAGCRSFM